MSKKVKYKRYMVFKWYEWDDCCPLDKCDSSFDDLNDAKAKCTKIESTKDDFSKACIFDRVEGAVIQ